MPSKITTTLLAAAAVALTAGAAMAQSQQQLPSGPAGTPGQVVPQQRPMAQQRFQLYDANRDGRISMEEMTARQQAWIGRFDTNNDGAVSRQEFMAAHQAPAGVDAQRRQRMTDRLAQRFDLLDRNRDQMLSRDEMNERARLSFDRLDADDDGGITPQELAQAQGGRRGMGPGMMGPGMGQGPMMRGPGMGQGPMMGPGGQRQ